MTPSHTRKRRLTRPIAALWRRGRQRVTCAGVQDQNPVVGAVWARLGKDGIVEPDFSETDRGLIERQVRREIIKPQEIQKTLPNKPVKQPTPVLPPK